MMYDGLEELDECQNSTIITSSYALLMFYSLRKIFSISSMKVQSLHYFLGSLLLLIIKRIKCFVAS